MWECSTSATPFSLKFHRTQFILCRKSQSKAPPLYYHLNLSYSFLTYFTSTTKLNLHSSITIFMQAPYSPSLQRAPSQKSNKTNSLTLMMTLFPEDLDHPGLGEQMNKITGPSFRLSFHWLIQPSSSLQPQSQSAAPIDNAAIR